MRQVIISFGLIITAIMVLLWVGHLHQFYTNSADDIWVALFGAAFLAIGIFLSRKFFSKSTIVIQHRPSAINSEQLQKSGISKREGEILQLMEQGLSNHQIADKLFISESTVKKHISNLFQKLRVERRTEAIKKAQELSILL